jgi:hypothetical protein
MSGDYYGDDARENHRQQYGRQNVNGARQHYDANDRHRGGDQEESAERNRLFAISKGSPPEVIGIIDISSPGNSNYYCDCSSNRSHLQRHPKAFFLPDLSCARSVGKPEKNQARAKVPAIPTTTFIEYLQLINFHRLMSATGT